MQDKFNSGFDRAPPSRPNLENNCEKLLEGLTELNELRKICSSKQKELSIYENQVAKLRESNRILKSTLIKALIEKEELQTRKSALSANINQLKVETTELIDGNQLLNSVENDVESMCQKFSSENQLKLVSKLDEAKRKLIKLGLQPRVYQYS